MKTSKPKSVAVSEFEQALISKYLQEEKSLSAEIDLRRARVTELVGVIARRGGLTGGDFNLDLSKWIVTENPK